jgi:hypothetical protein
MVSGRIWINLQRDFIYNRSMCYNYAARGAETAADIQKGKAL